MREREEKEENILYNSREHGDLGKQDFASSFCFFKTLRLFSVSVGVVLYVCFKKDSLHKDRCHSLTGCCFQF